MNSRVLPAAVAIALLVIAILAASYFFGAKPLHLDSATVLDPPRPLPAFSLTDDSGKSFTQAALQGHWTILYPGYTYCPDVCPTTLAMLKNLYATMRQDGHPLRVVFLSVDPQRDTPARMADYVHYFNPAFTGVTAPEPALGQFAAKVGIAYAKVSGKTPDTYSMDHTAALILIDPQARIAAYLTPPFKPEKLAADLVTIMEHRS